MRIGFWVRLYCQPDDAPVQRSGRHRAGLCLHGRDLRREIYFSVQFRVFVRHDGRFYTAARLDFFEAETEQKAGAGRVDVSGRYRAFDAQR